MRGYPGSGKSTKASEMAAQTGAIVVCRDTIRMRLFGSYYGAGVNEDVVTEVEGAEVLALITAGKDVIVDATHLNPRYVKRWAELASKAGAEFDLYDVLTEVHDCIINDANVERAREGKQVGPQVILKMAKRYPMERWPNITSPNTLTIVPYIPPDGKPFAVVVDVDGTLAHIPDINGKPARSRYDYTRVSTDVVDPCVRDIVQKYADTGVTILVVSGREDTCKEATITWLTDNGIPWSDLHMRKAKDYRNDTIIKYEIFDQYIRDDYRVLFCLDDRDRVVNMWRSLGLQCLQVAEGNF